MSKKARVPAKSDFKIEGDDGIPQALTKAEEHGSSVEVEPRLKRKMIKPLCLPANAPGHSGNVHDISISLDGTAVASCAADEWILVSNSKNGSLLHEIRVIGSVATSVVWTSYHGTTRDILTGHSDGAVALWRLYNGSTCPQLRIKRIFPGGIRLLKYCLSSRTMLIAFGDHMVLLNENKIFKIDDPNHLECGGKVNGAAFVNDGRQCIVTASKRKNILIFENKTSTLVPLAIVPIKFYPHTVAVSNDTMTIAVASWEGCIYVYKWSSDVTPLQNQAVIDYERELLHPQTFLLSFFHGSRFLLVGSEGKTATVIDIPNEDTVLTLEHQDGCYIHAVAVRVSKALFYANVGYRAGVIRRGLSVLQVPVMGDSIPSHGTFL
ncbi:hypothetical protein M408DRAFT_333908 [Serendipita vermifera MAFF 305830]|uniref:Uncharacterized protein n=1 Tax=Serendipita vermifera MAFF 305830 TaxID=933852 RepID=A0A0C3AMX3_SERVB|nr:hypothetical protein M408DRAFT_333908 [Serendipita vermifera MAFF 305830]